MDNLRKCRVDKKSCPATLHKSTVAPQAFLAFNSPCALKLSNRDHRRCISAQRPSGWPQRKGFSFDPAELEMVRVNYTGEEKWVYSTAKRF